ncbi:MAG: glycosyltransferase family 39 protein [Candidatus Shapirobacteria bacterium]
MAFNIVNDIFMVKIIKNNIILVVLMLLAIFLRTYKLDYLELFGDEIDAGYQSYSLMISGKDYFGHVLPLYMQSFSEWRAPGLMYAMVPFIKIFGLNEWGVRLAPAFFGVLSILGFYYLLSSLGIAKNVRLVTVLLLAITPWHIQYSRTAFELTMMSCGIIWGSYFLIRKKIILAGVLYCISLYTYNTANILVPLIALFTLFYFKASKKQVLTLAVTGLLLVLPLAFQMFFGHAGDRFGTVSIFSNKDIVAKVNDYQNAGGNSLMSRILYNKVTVGGKQIAYNYANAFGANFLFRDGDVTFRHSLHQVGNLFWIELFLIIFGVLVSKNMWLLGLLLIAPIPSSLTIDGFNHASRLFLMVFPLSYFASVGLCKTKSWLRLIVVLVLVFEFVNFQYYFWNFYRNESWRWWHIGYKESMMYIYDNKDKYQKIVMDNTYEPSLIRFLFWNKIDSKKVYGLNDGLDYFCIEDKYCFSRSFKVNEMQDNTLYFISHEKSVGGDWDWSRNPPSNVTVVKTVYNYLAQPIFYLVKKR